MEVIIKVGHRQWVIRLIDQKTIIYAQHIHDLRTPFPIFYSKKLILETLVVGSVGMDETFTWGSTKANPTFFICSFQLKERENNAKVRNMSIAS